MKLTQTNKGEFGYLKRERKRRIIIAAIMLGVPVFIFISMWIYLGTRNSIWTIIALVGSLPGCKAVVDVIMVYLARPVDPALYKKINAHQGELVMAYEMYMTFYEKKCAIDAIAVCGNTVVGYTSDPKDDTNFMAAEAQKLIRKNGYKVDVKILSELRPFLERLDSMNEHRESLEEGLRFTPDERYPDFTRDDMVKHVILNLCI